MAKNTRDKLAEAIADGLNKMTKGSGQIAYFLDTEETPTDLKDFVSTGSSILDLAISNRPHGGIACGRITELQGLEGSGKSLVAAHMIANVQKRDGVAVLIDTENALNEDFFSAVGIDMKKMVYSQINTVEQIFEAITNIIENVRSRDKDRLVLIVVDSLAAASTEAEMEADFDPSGYATGKAILISKALRKITQLIGKERIALVITQQLRQKLNVVAFADPWTTSGGKALGFHATTRVRFSLMGKIKNTEDVVVGVKVKAVITKSRIGPPHRTAEFEIYFDRGIDDVSSWLEVMKARDIVKKSGNSYVYTDSKDKEHSFTARELPEFLATNPEVKEEIYQKICEAVVMTYRSNDVSVSAGNATVVDETDD